MTRERVVSEKKYPKILRDPILVLRARNYVSSPSEKQKRN